MNVIGKIFVFAVFVMSLMLMTFAGAIYMSHVNWKDEVYRDPKNCLPGQQAGYIHLIEQAKKERQDAALAVRRAEIEAKVQAHLRSEIDTERQANNGKDEEIKRLRRSLDQIRKEQQAAAAAVAKAAAAAKMAETHSTPKKPTKANAGKSKPDESVSALKAEIAAMLQAEDAAVLGGVQKARLRLLETAKELAELEAVRPRLCVRACPHHGLSSRCGRWRCKAADPCCCAGA